MVIASVLDKKETTSYTPEEIYRWLREKSVTLGIEILLYPEEARMEGYYLYIPTYLPAAKDAYDYAVNLQKFEDAWNDQEPPPNPPINLISARSPEQNAVWQRLWHARIRKDKAADAAADAQTPEEQQEAMTELRAARMEELQAEKENDALSQRNRNA